MREIQKRRGSFKLFSNCHSEVGQSCRVCQTVMHILNFEAYSSHAKGMRAELYTVCNVKIIWRRLVSLAVSMLRGPSIEETRVDSLKVPSRSLGCGGQLRGLDFLRRDTRVLFGIERGWKLLAD